MVRLDRYMLSQFLFLFGFFALVLVGIFWINRGVSLFDQLISNGQSALVFLEFTVLGLPRLIAVVLPIATFAAAVYVTNRLITESELTVMQAAGNGPFRLALPVLIFGTSVFVMASILHHFLVPMSQKQLFERQAEVAQNATTQLFAEGRFLHPTKGVTFFTGKIAEDGVLHNVFLSDERGTKDAVIYTASAAYLLRNGETTTLIMIDGNAQRLDRRSGRLATANFKDFSFDISGLVSTKRNARTELRSLTTPEMIRSWDDLPVTTRRSEGFILYTFHERIVEPLFCVIAALAGFVVLIVANYSRFGVWREAGLAFLFLLFVDGARSALRSVVQNDTSLWALCYLPIFASTVLIVALLSCASRKSTLFASPLWGRQ